MTVIVGIVENGVVTIGGDSQTTSGWVAQSLAASNPKVFRVGPFLIGVTGAMRAGQVMRYGFRPPVHPDGMPDAEYMATFFVDECRRAFKDGGFAETVNGADRAGTDNNRAGFLVGYRGHLYSLWESFQIDEYDTPYVANGSGWEFALGALYAADVLGLGPLGKLTTQKRVCLALEAAARYSAACSAPFVIEELRP